MKGPENWGMIEDLANVLGAATACSKPVSDIGGDLTLSTLDKQVKQFLQIFTLLLVFLVQFSI
jgi:hypothetical protein